MKDKQFCIRVRDQSWGKLAADGPKRFDSDCSREYRCVAGSITLEGKSY